MIASAQTPSALYFYHADGRQIPEDATVGLADLLQSAMFVT
jgi:hypothetical protein